MSNEGQTLPRREITLQDWSKRSERNQHLLFIVAYRMIVHGETGREATSKTAAICGANCNTLWPLVRQAIHVKYKSKKVQRKEAVNNWLAAREGKR